MFNMVGIKPLGLAAFVFFTFLSTVHAQNAGECPQDDGKYRDTPKGEASLALFTKVPVPSCLQPIPYNLHCS